MLTEHQAQTVAWKLRDIVAFVEQINGERPTKLENLLRYALDEAVEERRRAREPVPAVNHAQQGAAEHGER